MNLDNKIRKNKVFEALKRYQAMELAVIPCKGKAPLLKAWQNRSEPPSDDEIETWQIKYPGANIGLVLGSAVGIVGVDVDGKEALEELRRLCGGELPETWTFRTPGSEYGVRLLFRTPRGIPVNKWGMKFSGEHSELALLGDGCQSIMPPSIHPNNKVYKWLPGKTPNDISLAEVPAFMLALMSGNKNSKSSSKVAKGDSATISTDMVLKRLAKRCSCFAKTLVEQQAGRLAEEDWFRWVSLLVNVGQPGAAIAFSQLSPKHDARSSERIQILIDKVGADGGPMTRCTTFGCDTSDIESCFLSTNESESGEITNSPGAFIRNMDAPLPPTHSAYAPYIKALKNNPDYTIDEYGHLCSFDRKGNSFRVANFVAKPVKEIIKDNGVEQTRTFRMEGIQSGGRVLTPIDVAATDFKRMNWVMEFWGLGPSIKPGFGTQDICRDAIQNMGQDIKQEIIYTHMGWRQLYDGQWVYLYAGGAIGSDNISVEIEEALHKYHLNTTCNDLCKAAKASLRLLTLAPLEITIPLLAIVYLSVLCEAFRQAGIEPTFVLWLFGRTGARKTALSILFLSHFGHFGNNTPPASFKDTANALERKAFAVKDALLLIDDYHPSATNSEAQKITQVAQRVLRMYGDRIGRSRMKPTTDFQKEYPPRCMGLVTGEDTPKGQSSVARFLGVEILAGQVDLNRLTVAQNESSLLAESMRGYIEWILPQMDKLPETMLTVFQEKRSVFQAKASHGRSGDAAAWLHIGFTMMLQYMVTVGVCSIEQRDDLLRSADEVFTKLIGDQNELVEEERPSDLFVQVLAELLLANKVRVDSLEVKVSQGIYDVPSGELIGWQDDEYYYLLPDITYNVMCKFLAGRGGQLSLNARTLWKHLDEAKLIRCEKSGDGRMQRTSKLPQKYKLNKDIFKNDRPRVLWLHKPAMQAHRAAS